MSTLLEPKNSYDEVPYHSYPYRQSHPDRLATVATLLGMQPPSIDRCRVLELGCAAGGNMIPMAEQLPESRFLGIDGSRRQIQDGHIAIEGTGLKNVELRHADFLSLGGDLGEFDYIIVHGVYSWVAEQVQQKILAICAECLAPQGVAYISYNTYPGWHMRGMMRYRARSFQQPADRIRESRKLLDFLAQSVPPEDNIYGTLLTQELNLLSEKEDSYLYHEHLEDVNQPCYFHEFVEHAEAKGLQYLGEAEFRVMAVGNLPRPVEAGLQGVATNVIEMEQYMDFVRNRMFRQTLLCRREVAVDRSLPLNRVLDLCVASAAKPDNQAIDLLSNEQVTFRAPGSVLTSNDPVVKAAILELRDVWPKSLPFNALLSAARARVHPQPLIADAGRVAQDALKVADPILRCYATSLVELSVHPSGFTREVSDRPLAPQYARWQADSSNCVTNCRHETVHLNDLHRQILRHLNGTRDRSALTAELVQQVVSGQLGVYEEGQAVGW
ncbi:MAG: methyltransferase regulatory domain-containing protein [Pirellulaceae bacterium]